VPSTTTQPNRELAAALLGLKLRGECAYEVAKRAGISASLLSRITYGHAQATDEVARAIAGAVGRPHRELFPSSG
jgi:transcriptional regulator with XRE-family HTH domain